MACACTHARISGTVDAQSDSLHAAALAGKAVPVAVPDAVFLAHGTELLSLLHLSFGCRGLAAHPFNPQATPWLYLLWPFVLPLAVGVAAFGRVFTADAHTLGSLHLETWVTPAFGVQFMMKREWPRLNAHIGGAIDAADLAGVRVIGLGALNKAEAINGGGALFVLARPTLRVRVVHGNTLTAAAVLRKIPTTVKSAFLTGATSKLGRSIALYLSARGVEVLMLTGSDARYEAIVSEATCPKQRMLLRRATTVADGALCPVWIVGKQLSRRDQASAPRGTTFHQFVVPPIPESRQDCFYTDLPAFKLPPAARGFKSCESASCVHFLLSFLTQGGSPLIPNSDNAAGMRARVPRWRVVARSGGMDPPRSGRRAT